MKKNKDSLKEADFVNPFSGMIPDRRLTPEELIRAIRLDIAAEEEAAHLYEAQADATDDTRAAEILRDIAKEEIVHVGEFQKLLVQLDPEESDLLNKGAGEVVQKVGIVGLPMERRMNILESNKSLNTYKKLLQVLGDYSTRFPGTGVSTLFRQAVEQGKKILPKDPLAVDILWSIVSKKSTAAAVNDLLNIRFSNLPINLRPLIQNGRSKEVAFFSRGGTISDKVKDLIDFGNIGKSGSWTDVDGNKVKLIDISDEEK